MDIETCEWLNIAAYFVTNKNRKTVAERLRHAVLVGAHLEQLRDLFEKREACSVVRYALCLQFRK